MPTYIQPDIVANWDDTICRREKLSEEFIREHQDKVNWFDICYYQALSEDFIREFKDKVDWGRLC